MKNRAVWLVAALMLGFLTAGASQAQEVTNLFQNPGFETGALEPWGGYDGGGATVISTVVTNCVGANVPEGPIEGDYCLHVMVSGPGTNFFDGAITPSLLPDARVFQKGKKYTLSLFLKSKNGTATINLKPELARDPYTGYGEKQVRATEKWAEYHTTTPVFTADVNPADVMFHVEFKAQEFWIDDVKWHEGDYVGRHLKAYAPVPPDGAVGIVSPVLTWTPGDTAVWHNVYLGTNAHLTAADCRMVNQMATTYSYAGGWQPGVTYYWRVDEMAADGTVHTGDLWRFAARGETAYNPAPADGTIVADPNPILTWEPGLGALRHQVFFGTKLDTVAAGTGDVQKSTVTTPLYLPGRLETQTTYYWRVDEFDGTRTYRGPVWSFTVLTTEGFEANDFSSFPWEHSGNSAWHVTSQESHGGLYSAVSGSIGDDETSVLSVALACVSGDIAFYRKVLSEPICDLLLFSIDGVEKGRWSGEQDWTAMSFPVAAGMHVFEWAYVKDSSSSRSSDAAWIDDITFPLGPAPAAP